MHLPEGLAGKLQSESTYIAIQADGSTTGIYINDGYVGYRNAGTANTAYECTVTISEYGGVESILAGTFSTTTGTLLITDGEFRVIRAVDGSSIMWPPE